MTRFFLCAAALAIGTIISAGVPARAEGLGAQSAAKVVNLDDLDLRTPEGQKAAKTRLADAAEQVCQTIIAPDSPDDQYACRRQAMRNARSALARDTETELASGPVSPVASQIALARR